MTQTSDLGERYAYHQRDINAGPHDDLFKRVAETSKPAIAVVIIYAISFYTDWAKAHRAAVSPGRWRPSTP